jgi:hypothetical protein
MNKKVDINSITVEDVQYFDYPDFCDAFISYAEYENGQALNDEELERFTEEFPEVMSELIFENQLWL